MHSLLGSRYRFDVGPTKKPDVLATPGFGSQIDLKAKRHKRSGSAGELFVSDRFRCAQYLPAIRSWNSLGRKNIMVLCWPLG